MARRHPDNLPAYDDSDVYFWEEVSYVDVSEESNGEILRVLICFDLLLAFVFGEGEFFRGGAFGGFARRFGWEG